VLGFDVVERLVQRVIIVAVGGVELDKAEALPKDLQGCGVADVIDFQ